MFFAAASAGQPAAALWKTDGTAPGTVLIADLAAASPPTSSIDFVAAVYFSSDMDRIGAESPYVGKVSVLCHLPIQPE